MDPFGLGGGGDAGPSSSSSGSDNTDSRSSEDSATARAEAAAARLRDFEAMSSKAPAEPTGALPSALQAFDEVAGRPAFLDPEATRPLAVSSSHGMVISSQTAGSKGPLGKRGKHAVPAEGDFDIAKLAPPGKGQQPSDKRGPPGAVIEGKAKRYKLEDGPEATQQYTAAQIAMMGGNIEGLQANGGGAAARGAPTKPMPVSDFLDRGLGGAALPRRQQDRKEKEKAKRAAGQSTHAHWKSEAEMVLRQQYDS